MVITTPKGKGVFPEDHPLYAGVLGFGGHESVQDLLRLGPDVVMICGSSMNDFSTNAWSSLLQPSRALIHIDIDASRFGRGYSADLCLLGHIHDVVGCMLGTHTDTALPTRATPPVKLTRQDPPRSERGLITSFEVMDTLNREAPANAVYTVDMGEHLAFSLHYTSIGPAARFMTCLGFGAMGSSIPVGIGWALGSKGRRVFIVCGDGGFQLSGSEINTAVQLGLDMTFVVLNDSRLNMCHFGMLDRYGVTNDFGTPEVDFAAVAAASGARGSVVRTVEQLRAALRDTGRGPLLLDVRVDPEVRLQGSQRTSALRQFTDNAETVVA
jgi:acetolactate synthase-1/2/3 large subunit